MTLTGRIQFRRSMFGKIILQAERQFMTVNLRYYGPGSSEPYPITRWADADVHDLIKLHAMGILPCEGQAATTTARAA